jgi:hypothetical protein
MKCIKTNILGKIERVTNDVAFDRVNNNKAIYIPKSMWKSSHKQVSQKEPDVEKEKVIADKKATNSVKGKKRKLLNETA